MNIIYKNMAVDVKEGSTVYENFEEIILNPEENIIACLINNEVKSLLYTLQENDEVELMSTSARDGARIYTRGLLFIMAMAFEKVYPEITLTINHQLSSCMYCKLKDSEVTDEMIANVKEMMKKIIEKNLIIKKVEMTKQDALKFMEKENTTIGKMQLENTDKDKVSLYFCDDYYNYFYGVMPISTGFIRYFDIMKYRDGFLILYPSKNEPNVVKPYKPGIKLEAALEDYADIYNVLGISTLEELNNKIKKGETGEVILLSEALHEKKIANIADQIKASNGKRIILIAGPSSSGKTTFAKRLGIQLKLNGLKPKTISVDNYFVERSETPRDADGKYDFEALEAVDLKLLNDHLTRLLNGEEVEMPTFDFKMGHKNFFGNKMKLEDDEILVMEGIHCLNDALTPAIPKEQKFKIFISALTVLNIDYYNRISTTDTRVIRRTVRDHQFRGYSAQNTLAAWPSISRGEHKNIFPYQEEADAMFNTSLIYEFNVLRKYALPLFEGITKEQKEYAEAKRLCEFLKYFEPISPEDVPKNSLLKEFIGGSIFEY